MYNMNISHESVIAHDEGALYYTEDAEGAA